MRVMIAVATPVLVAAAATAAMALHSRPAAPARSPPSGVSTVPGAAAIPVVAEPGLVWRSGTATVRLTDRPCPSDELALALEMEGVTKPRAYDVVQGGRASTGCWVKDRAGDVVTLEPGREVGSIPLDWFRAGG